VPDIGKQAVNNKLSIRSKMTLAPLFFCSVVVFSSAAYAGEGDFHCPTPGTQMETSLGGHLGADAGLGFDCRIKEGTKSFTMHAGFANAKNAAAYKDGAEKLWPLQVGKEVEYTTVCQTPGVFAIRDTTTSSKSSG
jgi:hypothetical protein